MWYTTWEITKLGRIFCSSVLNDLYNFLGEQLLCETFNLSKVYSVSKTKMDSVVILPWWCKQVYIKNQKAFSSATACSALYSFTHYEFNDVWHIRIVSCAFIVRKNNYLLILNILVRVAMCWNYGDKNKYLDENIHFTKKSNGVMFSDLADHQNVRNWKKHSFFFSCRTGCFK